MKSTYCVLIADVIHASRRGGLGAVLAQRLRAASAAHLRGKRIRVPYAITAGDEFQVVPWSIEMIPELILDLRRRMRPLELRNLKRGSTWQIAEVAATMKEFMREEWG